jgi:hypothetical protein
MRMKAATVGAIRASDNPKGDIGPGNGRIAAFELSGMGIGQAREVAQPSLAA